MLNTLIGQLFLLACAIVSVSGGLYATYSSRRKTGSEAAKNEADAENTSDKTWIQRLDALGKDLGKLQALSDERFDRMVELEILITEHVQWDFKVVRLLRQHDIEVDNPPSLVYVRRKLAEEKDAIRRQQNGEEGETE